jgi:hypothetical protein
VTAGVGRIRSAAASGGLDQLRPCGFARRYAIAYSLIRQSPQRHVPSGETGRAAYGSITSTTRC